MKPVERSRARIARQHVLQDTTASWHEFPYQSIAKSAQILGCSPAQIYAHLKSKKLRASALGGKTLIETKSLLAFLERAKPWQPNRRRVAAANERRVELAKQ
jgi:AcrR family transcriptional regulator